MENPETAYARFCLNLVADLGYQGSSQILVSLSYATCTNIRKPSRAGR